MRSSTPPNPGATKLMRVTLTLLTLVCLIVGRSLQAQEPKLDSATVTRATRPILRRGELLGTLAATGIAMVFDQKVRDKIHDNTDSFGESISEFGNAFGNGLYVYSGLLAFAVIGKAAGSRGMYGVSSRALKSTLLSGAGAVVLKSLIGRKRPTNSPDDPFTFRAFTFTDNSFPSGHTAVTFALATSVAREIRGNWDDLALFSLAAVTGYARMHDDRHWLSDVIFGAGIGILSARVVHRREAKLLIAPGTLGANLTF